MFGLIMLLYALSVIILPVLFLYKWKLERKHDLWCFLFGYYISDIFLFLIIFALEGGNLESIPNMISSLVIALLTLAVVWVELGKRPELRLLHFIPIIHVLPDKIWIVGYNTGKLSNPSTVLKVREASDVKVTTRLSFTIDLANIGYGEIIMNMLTT